MIGSAVVLAFAALLARCYWLQGVEGRYYAGISESNALHERLLRPARGAIVDHRGVVLATNRPSFDIVFLPRGVPRERYEEIAANVARIAGGDSETVLKLMLRSRKRPLTTVPLVQGVSRKVIAVISEHQAELEGVGIEDRSLRFYPLGRSTAHLMGYIGEVSDSEIEADPALTMGDWVGRAGVELALEPYLRGTKGREEVLLDALGQTVKRLSVKPRVAGARITLTVDADLQRWAAEAFGDSRGAFVALDPSTGRILALYSAPDYDPNMFVKAESSPERVRLFTDTEQPLFNRALQATYSPGSTFKTVTMIAGLITGKLTPSTRFSCHGMYAGMKCWKAGGHGTLDLVSGYQHSCNIYFYQAGERVWIDAIYHAAISLGLDQFPGFGIGPEAHGVVPTPEWERAHVQGADGQHWGTGDVRNTAIGQGYVLTSPAQMARMVGAAAMGGIRMKPLLIEKAEAADGTVLVRGETQVQVNLGMKPEDVETVRRAMRAVVQAGTARRAIIPGLDVGGKTGTAQNPQGEDHAWFICAAPLGAPRFACCALVEHAGHGGTAAAPIVRYVLERYARREGWIP